MTLASCADRAVLADPWWDYARRCAAALVAGLDPPAVTVYGPILDDDEQARLSTTAGVSRLLAGDGSYRHGSLLLFGSPGFTLGMLAAQGLVNRRRRRQAERDEIPAWRAHRVGNVVVTDQRIMCSASDGTLLDFWFGDVTEFYPDLTSRTAVFAFGEDCAPLRIDGAAAPAVALWAAVGLYGYRWTSDVRLQPLLTQHHENSALAAIEQAPR
jgi:hypothetical protein